MIIKKYDSWLAREETDIDGNIKQFNDCLISELMDDIYHENFQYLNELTHSMLTDICDLSSQKIKDYPHYDFKNVKTGKMLTFNNRTIAKACIDEKQGNSPIAFISHGNIDTNLILNILANFSSKIYDEYDGENITDIKLSIATYTDINTILDYYKELFNKLEQYYLNIGSLDDLYRLYENFYLMTNGTLGFPKNMNPNDLRKFINDILKNYKFLSECLNHIDQNYKKDYQKQIKPRY